LRTINVTRYILPLREGGSLPAIVEGDDQGMYVLKFRGAGQGSKALIAELVAGELARALDLPVPEIVFAQLDAELARTEGDPEIQHLIRASAGLNVALDYLPGAVAFDPLAEEPDALLASRIVWFDAFTSNVDRTPRNTNLLVWHRKLWLIDHGAALYFHHGWTGGDAVTNSERARDAFARIKDHVLLPLATQLEAADAASVARLDARTLQTIVASIPDAWLVPEGDRADAAAMRDAYLEYFARRLQAPRAFVEEAIRARSVHV
jgi:hypothetical protein